MSLLEWQGTRGADGTCPPSHGGGTRLLVRWFGSVSRGSFWQVHFCVVFLCLRSLFSSVFLVKKDDIGPLVPSVGVVQGPVCSWTGP